MLQRTRVLTLALLTIASAVGHYQWLRAPILGTWTRNQWSLAGVLAAMAIAGLASLRIRSVSLVVAAVAFGIVAGGTSATHYGNHNPLIESLKNYLSTGKDVRIANPVRIAHSRGDGPIIYVLRGSQQNTGEVSTSAHVDHHTLIIDVSAIGDLRDASLIAAPL